MDFSVPTNANLGRKSRPVEADLLMQMFAWQFTPDGEADDSTDFEVEQVFKISDLPVWTDKHQSVCLHERLSHRHLLGNQACDQNTLSSSIVYPCEAPEVTLTPRPFQSLALPEWVHERDAEDELAGIFKRCSLASFPSTPTSSRSSSPAISCLSSPEAPTKVDLAAIASRPEEVNVRRSAVSWADLAEEEDNNLDFISFKHFDSYYKPGCRVSWADLAEEEDNDFDCIWSAASSTSTAASSPATVWSKPKDACSDSVAGQVLEQACQSIAPLAISVEQALMSSSANPYDFFVAEEDDQNLLVTVNSGASDSQNDYGQHVLAHLPSKSQKCVPATSKRRWVDLVDSDIDPLDYPWSSALDAYSQ